MELDNEKSFYLKDVSFSSGILAWVSLGFGFGSWVWAQTQTQEEINLGLDSEFNSINFGIEINKLHVFKLSDNFFFCLSRNRSINIEYDKMI